MLTRFVSGLVVAVALAQLSLARAPLSCASHHTGSAPSSMSHEDTHRADASAGDMGVQADTSPRNELPPCHHTGSATDCASMTSCASSIGESQSVSGGAVRPSPAVVVGAGVQLASITQSPDTPPPRI